MLPTMTRSKPTFLEFFDQRLRDVAALDRAGLVGRHANRLSPFWAGYLRKVDRIGAHIFYAMRVNWAPARSTATATGRRSRIDCQLTGAPLGRLRDTTSPVVKIITRL
jgi:hypothetical protein